MRTADHRATHCFVGVTMRVRVREDEACGGRVGGGMMYFVLLFVVSISGRLLSDVGPPVIKSCRASNGHHLRPSETCHHFKPLALHICEDTEDTSIK